LYASNEHVEPACKMLDVAVKLRPDKPDYRERYVQALFDAGRCQDAVPHLHWLAKRIPNDFFYWQEVGRDMNRLGCVDSLAGIYAPVMAAVERRLEAYPDDLDAHLSAGILLGNLNRYEEAIAKSRRALEIDPDSPAGLFNTGMALLQLGRQDEARPLLEKFISLYPDHPMNEFTKQQLAP
ncbi:MAG: tetratricopeptide repeat protein, partial [Candidatus Krumholzibacteria bacterium]|nr:tetratricopeptide repeat protein [Candidatus Krumholzibacteria bacterium]